MVVPVMLRSRYPHQPARRFHHGLSRSAASSPSSFAAGLEQLRYELIDAVALAFVVFAGMAAGEAQRSVLVLQSR
jgi:hypothetical protein